MFLHFPQMHPDFLTASARAALPEGVRFLDPGLGSAASLEHVRSEVAPFDDRTAKALLADTLRFGENQAHPRDILAQSLIEQAGILSSESGRAVQLEVEKSVLGVISSPCGADALDAARRQAQMFLLLAWSLEERLLDLHGVEDRLKSAWDRLDQSVAAGAEVVEDEADQEALALGRELSGLARPETSSLAMPWRRLLESYAALMPGQILCTSDAEIGVDLAEAGVPEASLDEVPGAARVFRAQAWRLMGLDRLPDAKPWLDAMLTVGVFAQPVGNE
ncbi:MAG: hypothetical protein Q8O35_07755 [Humidesulfovibrio sp.]|jgi:hypothetical protein|uniref:hypothetical protein n=1 Tax=Humidesulfovibrio sp. TaxID=2910988 RepID=UPI0027340364|nr:hypothetical protein [Humidesulfovibrio sp.]MDP2848072.1 hypothetical protein [Humidesulfovibrio sp.]